MAAMSDADPGLPLLATPALKIGQPAHLTSRRSRRPVNGGAVTLF